MFLRSVIAVMQREWAWLKARPLQRWSLFLIPLFWLLVAWGIFSPGLLRNMPVILVDADKSTGSREVARLLDATPGAQVVANFGSLEEGMSALRRKEGYAMIYIPHNWERDNVRGEGSTVVIYPNMMYTLSGGAMSNEVLNAVSSALEESAVWKLSAQGGRKTAERLVKMIRVDGQLLFNPNTSFERYLAGSVLPSMLQFMTIIAAVCMLGREFVNKTVRSWMDSANGSVVAALTGKLLPIFLLNVILATMTVVWLGGWRGFYANGSVLLWLAAFWLMILIMVGMGMLFLGSVRNIGRALSVMSVYSTPMLAFSGFSMPLESMGILGRIWAGILPYTYYLQLQNMLWGVGSPAGDSMRLFLILLLFVVIAFGFGIFWMRLYIHSAMRKEAQP